MKQANISLEDRKVTVAAKKRAEETGAPAAAVELDDGRIITGKTSDLLGAAFCALIKCVKRPCRASSQSSCNFSGFY